MLRLVKAKMNKSLNLILREDSCQIYPNSGDIDVEFLTSENNGLAIVGTGIGQVIIREDDIVIGPIPNKEFEYIYDDESSGKLKYVVGEDMELQIAYTIKSKESTVEYGIVIVLKQNDSVHMGEIVLEVKSDE